MLLRDIPDDVKMKIINIIDKHYIEVMNAHQFPQFSYSDDDWWEMHNSERSEINSSSAFFKHIGDYLYTVGAFAAAFGRIGKPHIQRAIIDLCVPEHHMVTRSKHVSGLEKRITELENVINEQNLKLNTMSGEITALEKTVVDTAKSNTKLKEIINEIARVCD